MIKYIKKRGFTDKIYLVNIILVWLYTILCLVFSILGRAIGIDDYSFVSIVCPLAWVELGVHTGFVIHKAKVENLSKYAGNDVIKNANMSINMDI